MDVVADLVTGPFREVVEKGNLALENAGDNKEMRSESQKLVKGAERILKIIEPLCERHLEEYGVTFTDALKDDNEIAECRSQLTDMLWDFDDVVEEDAFEKEKYVELRELCKKTGLRTGEILKRMKLEAAPRQQPIAPVVAASPPAVTETQDRDQRSQDTPKREPQGELQTLEPGLAVEEVQEPSPPSTNPWDLKVSPAIEMGSEALLGDHIERRPPISTTSSPVSEPVSPDGIRRMSYSSSRQLSMPAGRMLPEEERYHQTSPLDISRSPILPIDRKSLGARARTSSATLGVVTEDQSVQPDSAPLLYRYSQASSVYSQASRQRSQESFHSSVFDGRRNDGSNSPAMTEHRISSSSGHGGKLSSIPPRGPVMPPNFLPGIHDGIERVPLLMNDGEGLIPVESESSNATKPLAMVSSRPKDCRIGLSSSFYLYKGFCEGAKEVTRGGLGIKKIKKPGFSGAHEVAKCTSCSYELDFRQVQLDVNNTEQANFLSCRIAYRPRFLQKSHVATKRADELLYGCVFCVHAQRTLEECDATVFFSQKKLFEHLARHPRPLPQVPGITVIEEAEIPSDLRNNYDLHFRAPPKESSLTGKQTEIARRPTATATQTVKRMYGMRLLYDNTPAFELANGARVLGIVFPEKYNGEWVMGWHEENFGSAPLDVLKLEPPPKEEIRMDTTSNISAVARWKFAPKTKDGGDWLRFDQGDVITNISWTWQDHWCWSGTNAKGVWGIFPQTHIDSNTIRETSDRSSVSSSERRRRAEGFFGRFASNRKASSQRTSSVSEVVVSSGPRPTVF
ncbi:SH3 domain-containing protein [Colletotrichum navitas]|uniref:SH3 domain-containing protein n=1 Tax=Colletotrichum navitas TaxID=681940 RepID=A0AAD8V621_9PEZI|nr:SH3 domain-containing protein [Colletotrichum navitas]KAK1594334.1 SH3 domain-containing protein [Colletotrichum navitas]